MSDPLFAYLRRTLPGEVSDQVLQHLSDLEEGRYEALLDSKAVRLIVGQYSGRASLLETWRDHLSEQLGKDDGQGSSSEAEVEATDILLTALSALQAFVQANDTGPPLGFSPGGKLIHSEASKALGGAEKLQSHLISSLSVDGEAAYRLTPHVELLCFAKVVLDHPKLQEVPGIQWARLRVNVVHQRVLSEPSPTLQEAIYDCLDDVDDLLGVHDEKNTDYDDLIPAYLLEKAAIHTHHGLDAKAREVLDDVAKRRRFDFALTGLLGKRTKYQEKETSQLVVLAKSNDATTNSIEEGLKTNGDEPAKSAHTDNERPQDLELNDDTLLERISFTSTKPASTPSITDSSNLPPSLSNLDPSNQPQLDPLDSTLLLALASSITNTRPNEGLTREETLPYAQRVLEGGSSNWQVYTQALLVRSRIEGYRSRTTERGLLQLQALVDQVISETTGPSSSDEASTHNGAQEPTTNGTPSITLNDNPSTTPTKPATFLPRLTNANSAPAAARLKYIYALNTPFRWSLESELAARWTSLGGLRSALEIYERLEMWAEVALCYAAVEREDKAVSIVKGLLYESEPAAGGTDSSTDTSVQNTSITDPRDDDEGTATRKQRPNEGTVDTLPPEKYPPSPDAPRLHCILSDLLTIPTSALLQPPYTTNPLLHPTLRLKTHHLTRALSLSQNRYTRASRALGRVYYTLHLPTLAAQAYHQALKVQATDHATWFALGCCLLETRAWKGAREAFARCVSLDDTDAEGWSNLAAAVVGEWREFQERRTAGAYADDKSQSKVEADEKAEGNTASNEREEPSLAPALPALKRASTLSHSNARIWLNLLSVSTSLTPPSWTEALVAQRRICELCGEREGEGCIDLGVVEGVAGEVLTLSWMVDDGEGGDAGEGGDEGEKEKGMVMNPALQRGLPRQFLALLNEQIIPLITHSARLWRLVARVRLWQGDWDGWVEAGEAGWRVVVSGADGGRKGKSGGENGGGNLAVPLGNEQAGGGEEGSQQGGTFEEGNAGHWEEVVEATLELVDGYESLAGKRKKREDGVEVDVLPDWRFKGRSAIRGIMGKGKALWEDSEGFERLRRRLEELKGR